MTAVVPQLIGGLWPNEAISGPFNGFPTGTLVGTWNYPNFATYSTAGTYLAVFFSLQFGVEQYMYPLVPPPTFTGFTATFGGLNCSVIFEPQNPLDPNYYPPDFGGYLWEGQCFIACAIPNGYTLPNTTFTVNVQGSQLYEGFLFGDIAAGACTNVDPAMNIATGVMTNTSTLNPSNWSMTLPAMGVPANDMVVTGYVLGSSGNTSVVSLSPSGYTLEGYHNTGAGTLIGWKVLSSPQGGSLVWSSSDSSNNISDQRASAVAFYIPVVGSLVRRRRVMQLLE